MVGRETKFGNIHTQLKAFFKKIKIGAGEMAQRLRVLAALLEDSGLISSTYMAARNYL